MIPIIGPLLGLISTGVEAYAEHNKLKLQQKSALEQAKIDRIKAIDAADADWDRIMAEGSVNSWKDEYWTLVLSVPAILAFFPDMVPHVKAGFQALSEMPEWYIAALLTAVAASFGMRTLAKWKIK
jgi:hypothetical protein